MNRWYVEGHKDGHVLLKTWHTSKGSAQIEVSAWVSRMKRGEVDTVFVTAPGDEPSFKVTHANLHELKREWGGDA